MPIIEIKIVFDELPAEGEICDKCKSLIKGEKYVMMLQVGSPLDAKPMAIWCEDCKKDFESK